MSNCSFYDQETNEFAFFGKRLIMMTHCNQVKTRASPQLVVSVSSYYETHPSPCGRHLHCLHSWSRGQNSSALGAVSSQSQPVTCHVISLTRHTLAKKKYSRRFVASSTPDILGHLLADTCSSCRSPRPRRSRQHSDSGHRTHNL